METKRVIIDFADGAYSFMETELTAVDDPRVVEVPVSTLTMWYAVADLERVVQTQLRQLDDDIILAGSR